MFRKVTLTVTAVLVIGVLATCVVLFYQFKQEQQQQKAKAEQLREEMLTYHKASELEAHMLAGYLAAPYYRLGKGPWDLSRMGARRDVLMDSWEVISNAMMWKYPHTSTPERWKILQEKTPARAIIGLALASHKIESLLSKAQPFLLDSETARAETRQEFEECRQAMKAALQEANNWKKKA